MFLFLCFFLSNSHAGNIANSILPPVNLLHHYHYSKLPKPYWPFNVSLFKRKASISVSLDQNQACDFPALAFYKALEVGKPPPNFENCPDLLKYLDKVPIDTISLVYASENLVSPSSMMGHTFLKLSGLKNNGERVEHAVSFYTNIESNNIPKLFLDTMLWGKKGIFSLSPYPKFKNQYVNLEQRNLWEYSIKLSDVHLKLIQLHLWELKNADLPYFFDRYNCATLISHILRIGHPNILVSNLDKVSPIDLVKAVEKAQAVKSRSVILSPEWKTRMLSETVSPLWVSLIKEDLINSSNISFTSDHERFLVSELGLAYSDYRLTEQQLSTEEATNISQHYLELKEGLEHLNVDLSSYKSPSKLSNDTQWFLGYLNKESQSWVRIGYLPAGLRKEDDSRQYFGNNELKLLEGAILINPNGQQIEIDKFSFYSVSSLKPYNTLTGGVSGMFEVVIEDHFDHNLNSQKSFNIEGGIGLTKEFFRDTSGYSLASIGIGYGRGSQYLHSTFEAGLVMSTIFNSKLSMAYKRSWGQLGFKKHYDASELIFSKFISHNWTALFEWHHFIGKNKSINDFSINIKYLY